MSKKIKERHNVEIPGGPKIVIGEAIRATSRENEKFRVLVNYLPSKQASKQASKQI